MPAIPGIQVIRSAVHGYGVIATRDFAAGDLIAEVDGVLYAEADVPEDDTYCLWIADGWYLDMADQTRWINHSCDPNAGVETSLDENGSWSASIRALRPIAAGEEIAYDYAFDPELAEPCHCGAPTCRGLIIDPDALPPLGG